MKIAQKLGLLVGSLLVAVLATIVLLSAQISTTSDEYEGLINNQLKQRAASRTMLVEFGRQVQDFQTILLDASSQEEYDQLRAVYDKQTTKVHELTDKLLSKVGPQDPRLRTSLIQLKTTQESVNASYESALNTFEASGFTNITGPSTSVQGQEQFANDLVTYVVNYRQRTVDQALLDQADQVAARLRAIYIQSALVLLAATIAVVLVVRGIVKPIRLLTATALDAANNRLPKVVAQIATMADDAATPSLPSFEVTTKDEIAELATALTSLQDSAVDLALDQRRNERANAETLVNLGRRNQSLLTRMLSYVTELERDERDSETLDKLFRLDHLTTRIRRNAESLLVLAGAKQTRTWSQPIAIDDVLRAALSEIEEYTRVTIHHADHARVHGGVAADLTHMLAELLENATRFSPRERQVLVVGRLTPSGYQFDLIDAGLGMSEDELEQANSRITMAGQRRPDTKVLGHHVVGRIAARRGIFVRLLPSVQTGITAQVLVPATLLSDTGTATTPAPAPALTTDAAAIAATQPARASQLVQPAPVAQPVAQPAPQPAPAARPQAPAAQYQPTLPPAAAASAGAPLPAPSAGAPLPAPRSEPRPDQYPAAVAPPMAATPAAGPAGEGPVRRVRGAQLAGLGDQQEAATPIQRDPGAVRSQMSSLQSGVAAARREYEPQPIPYTPATVATGAPVPVRRVRGAQLAELGEQTGLEVPVPPRDPEAIGRQLAGLQAGFTRARLETGMYAEADRSRESGQHTDNDDNHGSNA